MEWAEAAAYRCAGSLLVPSVRFVSRIFSAALLLLCVASAYAQDGSLLPASVSTPMPDAPTLSYLSPSVDDHYVEQAWGLSIVGTLAPTVAGLALITLDPVEGDTDRDIGAILAGAGLFFGPSLGHFYLDDDRRASRGIGLRMSGLVLGSMVVLAGVLSSFDGSENDGFVTAALLATAAGWAGGTAYSFATLSRSAQERGLAFHPGVSAGGGTLALVVRL